MDDPWGSPWASNDTPSTSASATANRSPSLSRANTFLSPPPKAFFGNGSSLSPQSPWSGNHDDGGLNIWSATATRPDDTDSQNEWSPWADSAVQPPRLSPRLSPSAKESTLAWPENAAASPVFLPNSRSRTPSILRHHSPDPWAAEPTLTNRSDLDLPNSIQRKASNASALGLQQVQGATQASSAVTENSRVELANNGHASVDAAFTVGQNSRPRTGRELAADHATPDSHPDSAAHEPPSRPSSTCTTNSHDGPDRQDSPITSIDEDRGGRMQNSGRKVSAKVQELVGIYDGLARAASEEPPPLSRRRLSQTAGDEDSVARGELEDDNGSDGGAGFGDFEDPLVDDGRIIPSRKASSLSELSSTPKAEANETFNDMLENGKENSGVTVAETEPAPAPKLPNRFRGLNFDTNLSALDELFPSDPDSLASDATQDREISDHIVADSFNTISERKAWYRISRFGSMRKHNSGDDENYHRVTWPVSQLCTDTVKIVRRWMEQDTYAGRATLGGHKRTGFFDWDSDAAPVDLDQVFQRKKSVTKHARTTSIPAVNASPLTKATDERPYRNSTGISLPKALPASNRSTFAGPSFGWNSETHEATLVNGSVSENSQALEPEAVPGPVPQTTFVDENDDDWGEMVSSPRVTQDHMELNAAASQLPEIQAVYREPESRPSLAEPDVHHTTEPTLPASEEISAVSDQWSFFDVSALEKPNHVPKLSQDETCESNVLPSVPISNTPPLSRDSFEPKDAAPKQETLGEDNIISRRTATTAPKRVLVCSSLRDDETDDIVIQRILQRLPDLSYMFR